MENFIKLTSSYAIHHRHVLQNSTTKFPPFNGNPGVHYRVNNSPPLDPIFHPFHPPWFDHSNNIWWASVQSSVASCVSLSGLSGPLSNLISDTLSLCHFRMVGDSVSHLYRAGDFIEFCMYVQPRNRWIAAETWYFLYWGFFCNLNHHKWNVPENI